MLDGEKLQKFETPIDAAEYYTPRLTRDQLESQNKAKQPDETFSIKTAKKLDKKVRQASIENAENPWYD